MPMIEISDAQAKYLGTLREKLAAEFVGEYGHVRDRDAIQYLIDVVEDDLGGVDIDLGEVSEEGDPTSDPADDADRLTAMMNLLETHEDKWEKTDSDDGQYVVELPDGDTEQVRTRDDVRAVLFKHYT